MSLRRLSWWIVLSLAAGLTGAGSQAQTVLLTLRSFGFPDVSGANPAAALAEGRDGVLYGTTAAGGKNNAGSVYRMNRDGSGYGVVHGFELQGADGVSPLGAVIQGSDGALYGTTAYGGSNNLGTVFRVRRDGAEYQVLHHFGGEITRDGESPLCGLVEAANGALYGTTALGGSNDLGTIYKLSKDGTGFAVIHHFAGGNAGDSPMGSLTVSGDGLLYGTTFYGGPDENGVVFKVNTNGSGYSVLYGFGGSTAGDGANPAAGLLEGSDGVLYGTTSSGGTEAEGGTVFKLNKNGSGYAVLYRFTASGGDGANPKGGLVEGTNGTLYGTTSYGGVANRGLVFKLAKSGSGFEALHHFTTAGGDGSVPDASLLKGSDGLLYGATVGGGLFSAGVVFRLEQAGEDYAILLSFNIMGGDGYRPQSSLVGGSSGALHGTTSSGGSHNRGTVFTVQADGSGHAMLHHFAGTPGDGAEANGDLIEASNGWLYGTTYSGGVNNRGTVFRLAREGTNYIYTVLHQFTGTTIGGGNPHAGVIEGSDGWLYGTTYSGGRSNRGTVYKLGTNGTGLTLLYSFTGGATDGRNPRGGLVEGSDGALYGTTEYGGNADSYTDRGTVYKVGKDGSGYQVLHHFSGAVIAPLDGRNPRVTLLRGSDQRLYGTTYTGGSSNVGTIFRLDQSGGNYQLIHSFTGGLGANPRGKLVEGTNGALYGVTYVGGSNNVGTVYRVNKDGSGFVILHHLADAPWGQPVLPQAGLSRGADGMLFGTSYSGGSMNLGSIFKVTTENDPLFNRLTGLQATSAGVSVRIRGVPGQASTLERSPDLSRWTGVARGTAPPDGWIELHDGQPTIPAGFYRTVGSGAR